MELAMLSIIFMIPDSKATKLKIQVLSVIRTDNRKILQPQVSLQN